MQYRALGRTGIDVSAIAFGAGPVPELMTADAGSRQRDVVRRALDAGINWFDTAATYGEGRSEQSLGDTLNHLSATDAVHIATKVRFMPQDLTYLKRKVRNSFSDSMSRLRVSRVTLLQLHNSITLARGDEPTSITPQDVLGPGGVLEAFRELQSDGLVDHLGLTGIGNPNALAEVVNSGRFATMQVPFNVLNPSAGQLLGESFEEANYGNIIAECARQEMGVFAIRVFAGGALADQPPSRHTYKTKFFPLDLYHRDQERCRQLASRLSADLSVKEVALRFVLSHEAVTSPIIGFGAATHVDEAVKSVEAGALPADLLRRLRFDEGRGTL
jgi:aryl-alcohol dehydrogenase-like predicted oxidoreductase